MSEGDCMTDTLTRLALVYSIRTGKYAIHAAGCNALRHADRCETSFFTDVPVSAIVADCHDVESSKAGEPVKARVTVCKCVTADSWGAAVLRAGAL